MSHRGKSHEELLETIKAEALRDSSLVASKSLLFNLSTKKKGNVLDYLITKHLLQYAIVK